MPLTDTAIRKAPRKPAPYKLADTGGLYVVIRPTGGKWWRLDYRRPDTGQRNTISLGVYPDVGLKEARVRRDDERKRLGRNVDPGTARREAKAIARIAAVNTFAAVAREWLGRQTARLSPATLKKTTWLLEAFLLPSLGTMAMHAIEPPIILDALRRVESRGRHETAHRARTVCSLVFRYAVATGRATRDLTLDLKGALTPVTATHRAALTRPAQIGALLRAIDSFDGTFVVATALRLAPLVFVRPGELRQAEWSEIDLDAAIWRIPAARMKMRDEHLVPLARQAAALLKELQPLTGTGRFLFPSHRTTARPMSNNTLNACLRRLGYAKSEMTAHGFRAIASTRLNELGWRSDVIERQLAHAERDQVRAAYNRAEYLADRRAMMQAWADELDRLRQNVVAPRARAKETSPNGDI